MDKATWSVPSTIYTMVNCRYLLWIRFSFLCLQGFLPVRGHKLGMEVLIVTLVFSLKSVLTRLEFWEFRRRNERGVASGVGEVSRPAGHI